MEIIAHQLTGTSIAEIVSAGIIISSLDDALDLIGNISYQGFDCVILHAKNITPEFFDLKTRLAGEILQKFTTYRLRVCIVGDFTNVQSNSFRDFIFESNKSHQVNFVATTEEALLRLTRT